MRDVVIIGIGSPHGADRAGWQAIDALQRVGLAQCFSAGQVSLAKCAQPGELYALLEDCRFAILIDAVPAPAGRLLWLGAADLQRREDLASVHGVGAGEMLGLIDTLAERPPQVAILGIGADPVGDISPFDHISEPALCCLRGQVEQAVRRFFAADSASQKNVSERA